MKHKVILLPTKEVSNIVLLPVSNYMLYNDDAMRDGVSNSSNQHLYIVSDEEPQDGCWYINGRYLYKADRHYQKASNDLKVVATTQKSLIKVVNDVELKIDFHIPLYPQPTKEFIRHFISEYNKGNLITDVEVEYEEEFFADSKGGFKTEKERDDYVFSVGASHSCWTKTTLIVNQDNTINIKVPRVYTEDEVIELLRLAWATASAYGENTDEQDCMSWIKDNLRAENIK